MNINYTRPFETVQVRSLKVGDSFVLDLKCPEDTYIVYDFDGTKMNCIRFRKEGSLPLEISLETVSLSDDVYQVETELNVAYLY